MIGKSISYFAGKKIIELSNNETSSEIKYIEITVPKNNQYGVQLSKKIDIVI